MIPCWTVVLIAIASRTNASCIAGALELLAWGCSSPGARDTDGSTETVIVTRVVVVACAVDFVPFPDIRTLWLKCAPIGYRLEMEHLVKDVARGSKT